MLKKGLRALSMHRAPMKLESYLKPKLPPLPVATGWAAAVDTIVKGNWGMLANGPDPSNPPNVADGVGDCTVAAPGHQVMVVTANTGKMVTPTTADCLGMYEQLDGYVPGNASTDNGGTLEGSAAWMVKNGLAGVKALGFVEVDPANLVHDQYAIYLFAGVWYGIYCPQSAMEASEAVLGTGKTAVWDDTSEAAGPADHCIYIADYLPSGDRLGVSWGAQFVMTKAFREAYVQEVCAVYYDTLEIKDGIDAAQFLADAESLKQ